MNPRVCSVCNDSDPGYMYLWLPDFEWKGPRDISWQSICRLCVSRYSHTLSEGRAIVLKRRKDEV